MMMLEQSWCCISCRDNSIQKHCKILKNSDLSQVPRPPPPPSQNSPPLYLATSRISTDRQKMSSLDSFELLLPLDVQFILTELQVFAILCVAISSRAVKYCGSVTSVL